MDNNKISLFQRFLNIIEKSGNALPHPATLFAIFALLAILFSWLGHVFNWQAVHPGTQEIIIPENLISKDGLHRIILEMVNNFTGFAPLGIVIVAMLGIGIAEQSGLIDGFIRLLVLSSPKRFLTFIIVFAGIMSNMASSVGYVLLIPLAGIIFIAVKRHPIVGMAAAFAGVSGGYSANLALGTIDPLLAGLSTEAAHIVDPAYEVNPTANYFFMFISTFFIAIAGTWVTEKIIAPRFGEYKNQNNQEKLSRLKPDEKRGMLYASIILLLIIAIVLAGTIPVNGFFRGPEGKLLTSPLIKGIIAVLFITAGLMGLAYGIVTGKFKNDTDVMIGMGESMKTLGIYLVLVFFAAQFVAYFKWSNLGLIIAIKGSDALTATNLGIIPLMVMFIVLSGTLNLLMGSASAKWAILAPIFIPLFMFMGFSPELSQVVYRIGDSTTNIISPMMSFFALIIAFFQKYDNKARIGTVIATMLPYSFVFFIVWTILLIIWILLGIPLGPGANLYYTI